MSGHNVFAGHWLASSAATQIELTVIDWLRQGCGLPNGAGGILVSGGSMANLSAIVAAREAKLGGHDMRAVVYCSDQTHSSMFKGLRILGFGHEQRRAVATDDQFRLSVPAPMPARPTPVPSTRSRSWRPCARAKGSGCTWTARMAQRRR
jgi:glutamate/tyrosine decarboxylase-like PLP-dependent enzyme